MTPTAGHLLTYSEYLSATRADHGTLRRFLSGCRCTRCDRPAHHRFVQIERARIKTHDVSGKATPA